MKSLLRRMIGVGKYIILETTSLSNTGRLS